MEHLRSLANCDCKENDEGEGIKEGQSNQELVEGVAQMHLHANHDYNSISEDSQDSDDIPGEEINP